MEIDDINNRFQYHEATGAKHRLIRVLCCDLAKQLNAELPEGREKSLAITHLEETMFWAKAAIARS